PVGDGAAQAAAHPLLAWMQRHGNDALLGELALLGVLTVAAIAADPWWERRSERRRAMRDEVIDHENSSRC
ncbi:MAG TPA: hypothetical protein PJ982_14775, partial [Lacipirellulaceae bacterium]|nr:hypothetical protein [Lacipirellulaceae bacterium]